MYLNQVSKFSQARIALSSGYWQDKNENPLAKASIAEALMLAGFGIQPTNKTEAYELRWDAGQKQRALKEDAEKWYGGLKRRLDLDITFGSSDMTTAQRDKVNYMIRVQMALLDAHPLEDRPIIEGHVREMFLRDIKNGTGVPAKIAQDAIQNFKYGSASQHIGHEALRIDEAVKGRENAPMWQKFMEFITDETYSPLYEKQEEQ